MHDDGTPGGPLRQVKVDNWGIFFLQRLQQFFNRSDHCDLTLQFSGNVKIKVHRLVLNACTEYFQVLEKKMGRNKDNCLQMPTDLSPEVVLPIINFMYTGRLEFRDTLTKKLYYTAGRLNMPVLTKLLDAQGASDMSSDPSVPTVSLTPKLSSTSSSSKNTPNVYGAAKKIIGKELPETLPGRKLPIWKKRRTPFLMSSFDDSGPESAAMAPEHAASVKEEPARPTRFEWPEDEEALKSYVPPFDSITYESAPLQPHTTKPLPAEDKKTTFEELQSQYKPIKRQASPIVESTPKKSKIMDIQSVKEYLQEQEVRKQIVSNEEDAEESLGEGGMALGDVDDDDEDDDEREAESILPESEEMEATEESQENMSSTPQQTKSILKQRYTEEVTPASKKVRFSLAANQEQTFLQGEEYTTDFGEGTSDIQASPANHAKIISEVLKKYPHLVRDNKNIRLRIMKQGSCQASETETKNKKVSYVVLKAGEGGKNRSPAKVIVKTGGRVEHISSLIPPTQTVKPISGAENITGPWLCFTCGTNENPINFESYYLYRRHLQDIHMEKIDARICEHCGHRASKRNLLLYHLYTKHNIPPPRNCQFPKCDQCDYVALSESLLIKHRNNHSNAKDFVCKVCNASFKSNGALQGHMQTNLHSDPDKKKYSCPYCQKPFVRNINLKAHIRSAHKDVDRKLEEEYQQEDEIVNAAEEAAAGNVVDPKRKRRRDILLLRGKDSSHSDGHSLLANNAPPPSLEPSSEAEALSNVASGIAASLGLADQLTEVHEHQTVVQTMPGADGTVQTFIISAVPGQGEYIVPEMLANAAGGEQYQIATTSSLGELVHYDASHLGSVVSSLAGVGGQQTIVITTAPSGGQEHLKLISADGSTLDQVTLLTGQNLLVTNPDGTTSTASATEGYQAILQPNGVLTLQPVGTHVIQGEVHDGETISEEALVHQGYVTQGGSILTLASSENVKDMEQAIALLPTQVDTKPYTIITTGEHHVDTEAEQLNQQQVSMEAEMMQEQEIEQGEQLSSEMLEPMEEKHETNQMPIKSRIIGKPVPIQTEDMRSEIVSNSVIQSEMQHEALEDQSAMMNNDGQVEMQDVGAATHEGEQLEVPIIQTEEEMTIGEEEMTIGEEVNPGQLLETEEQVEMHEGADMVMAAAAAAAAEEAKPVVQDFSPLETMPQAEEMPMELPSESEQMMETEEIQASEMQSEEIAMEPEEESCTTEVIQSEEQMGLLIVEEGQGVEEEEEVQDHVLLQEEDVGKSEEYQTSEAVGDDNLVMHEEVPLQESDEYVEQSADDVTEEGMGEEQGQLLMDEDCKRVEEIESQQNILLDSEEQQVVEENEIITSQEQGTLMTESDGHIEQAEVTEEEGGQVVNVAAVAQSEPATDMA
ncbi:Centrosomal Protein 190 [Ephemera danica]|nr:Centrosomal Protein 190 [Ephemera danica]